MQTLAHPARFGSKCSHRMHPSAPLHTPLCFDCILKKLKVKKMIIESDMLQLEDDWDNYISNLPPRREEREQFLVTDQFTVGIRKLRLAEQCAENRILREVIRQEGIRRRYAKWDAYEAHQVPPPLSGRCTACSAFVQAANAYHKSIYGEILQDTGFCDSYLNSAW